MAKKTKVTQRAREEQWRRRVEQQSRPVNEVSGRAVSVDDMPDGTDDAAEYMQADIRPMPSGVSTSARTASTAQTARTPRSAAAAPAATRRSAAATRASRLAFQQTMSLDEEMHYVRSDIRQLIILTAVCLAVLIVLSFFFR
jgi:hypothetical protein